MGSIPWNALLFFTLYLQLIGMSDFSASLLVSLFFGAVALGNLLGGWVGDKAASRFPNAGRIAVTQFSVFIGIPLSWLLVKVTKYNDDCSLLFSSSSALPHAFMSWCVPPTSFCFVADPVCLCHTTAMLDTKAPQYVYLHMGIRLHSIRLSQRPHTHAHSGMLRYTCVWA